MADQRRVSVNYGSFACTVEGMDDPLAVLREVFDICQDVAARNPRFGAPEFASAGAAAERALARRMEERMARLGAELTSDPVEGAIVIGPMSEGAAKAAPAPAEETEDVAPAPEPPRALREPAQEPERDLARREADARARAAAASVRAARPEPPTQATGDAESRPLMLDRSMMTPDQGDEADARTSSSGRDQKGVLSRLIGRKGSARQDDDPAPAAPQPPFAAPVPPAAAAPRPDATPEGAPAQKPAASAADVLRSMPKPPGAPLSPIPDDIEDRLDAFFSQKTWGEPEKPAAAPPARGPDASPPEVAARRAPPPPEPDFIEEPEVEEPPLSAGRPEEAPERFPDPAPTYDDDEADAPPAARATEAERRLRIIRPEESPDAQILDAGPEDPEEDEEDAPPPPPPPLSEAESEALRAAVRNGEAVPAEPGSSAISGLKGFRRRWRPPPPT